MILYHSFVKTVIILYYFIVKIQTSLSILTTSLYSSALSSFSPIRILATSAGPSPYLSSKCLLRPRLNKNDTVAELPGILRVFLINHLPILRTFKISCYVLRLTKYVLRIILETYLHMLQYGGGYSHPDPKAL